MQQITKGQLIAFFAFDVGYEISLEQLRALTTVSPAPPISRKKLTPAYLQYTRPPQVLSLGAAPALGNAGGTIQATVFDFGAISITCRWPMTSGTSRLSLADLPELSHQLYHQSLESHARELLKSLVEKIKPAITRPALTELVEDYYLFIIEELDQPWRADDLLNAHRATLAQTLRFETLPLSAAQQEEALQHSISYYEHDLVIVDWNSALICDRDYEDSASVLELLNVELLEARYIDEQLDKRIAEYATLVRKPTEWPIPLRTPYKQAIQDLAELRLESSLLAERVDNSLKLIGDLYLARLHSAATARFYLQEWERSISRKLEIISGFYQLLDDRVRMAQSQTLELIIIALILVELLLALFS